MTTTPELIARCRTDLGLLPDLIAWAHADGYNPTNTPTERPMSVYAGLSAVDDLGDWLPASALAASAPTDPDHVPGPRYDLGLGSHTSRHAYTTAIAHINAAELSIATAWTFTTGRRPNLLKPLASHQPGRAIRACQNSRRRLDDLVLPAYPYATRVLIGRAAANLNTAWTTLNGAFTIGAADPNTQARAKSEMCVNCGIRERAQRAGGRCHTCKTWRDRHGYERPADKLDSHADAIAAQERRAARGEGYGEG